MDLTFVNQVKKKIKKKKNRKEKRICNPLSETLGLCMYETAIAREK